MKVELTATAAEPIYETIVVFHQYDLWSNQTPPLDSRSKWWEFSEAPLPTTESGNTFKEYTLNFVPPSPSFGSVATKNEQTITWSIGPPPGSAANPYLPVAATGDLQNFSEVALCDAAVRYHAPKVDAAIALGFDLSGAEGNPFTSFRFPDVPIGANDHFTLELGDTEIGGLAGETVNLRQYAPDGISALTLHGDLTPFLPTAAATDAAIPIGGPPPQLTFGLAFAQPGIGSFTLKPVPEPATCLLGSVGAVVVFLCWRRRSSRLLAVAASCLLVGNPLPAATINMSVFLDANGVVDPRGPGRQDDLPIVTASAARGVGVFELDTTTNVLSYEILFTDQLLAGLEIGADLRAPDSTADVLFPLPLGHFKAGVTRPLAPDEVASLSVGAWAVSIRTEAYPTGEIGSYIGTAPEPAGGCLALTAIVLLAVFSRRKHAWPSLLLLAALASGAARADILPLGQRPGDSGD